MADEHDGGFVFGEGDLPDELKALLRKAISSAMSGSDAHDVLAHDIRPSPEQFELGPGQLVMATNTDSFSDSSSVTVAEILDPKEFEDDYPDWEQRVMNSYLLCRWYSVGDAAGHLGWFPRSKLVELSPETYAEGLAFCRGEKTADGPVPWITTAYTALVDQITKANDNFMPVPMRCEKCGSLSLTLMVETRETKQYGIGRMDMEQHPDRDPNGLYVFAVYGEAEKVEATLSCSSCDFKQDFAERDEQLYMK